MLLSEDCLIIPSIKNLHKGYNWDTLYWVVVFGASDTTGHSMGDGTNFCGFLKLPVTKELLEFTYLIWDFTILNYFSEFKSIHTLPWHPLRPYNYCLECYETKHFMSIYNGPNTRIFQQESSNFKVVFLRTADFKSNSSLASHVAMGIHAFMDSCLLGIATLSTSTTDISAVLEIKM